MKKKLLRSFINTILLAAVLFAMAKPLEGKADFGDFSGDSDYGSSWDSDSSDSWSSDSSSSWDWDDDDDYSSSSSWDWDDDDDDSDDGPIESLFNNIFMIIGIIVIFGGPVAGVVLFIIGLIAGPQKGSGSLSGGTPVAPGAQPTENLRSMDEFRTLDPGFDEAAFTEHLSNLYVQMQEQWHNRDIEDLKPYFTDALYNQSARQLAEKKRAGQTPCTERVAVLEVKPRGFYQSGGLDHMVVRVRTRIVAYTLDDATGEVISGDRNKEKFMEYEWDLSRKSGVITEAAKKMQSISCPNCSASLDINQTARCPYCGSVVTVVNEDWALSNIKGISQRTV